MALTQTTFNEHKIYIYKLLADYYESYITKRKYSIKACSENMETLILAATMFAAICPLCLNDDDENYCLDNEDLEDIVTYIENLLNIC